MNPQHSSVAGLVIAIAIVVLVFKLLNDRRPISMRRIGLAIAIILGTVGAYVGWRVAFSVFS